MNQELPKSAEAAMAILATLQEKDADETICRYPMCRELRQVTTGSGRPSAYCQNPEHTALTNHRARQQLKAIAADRALETTSKRENPAGVTQVDSLRQTVVSGMLQLQNNLERYVGMLTEMTDPDITAAQIQAAIDRAEARIAEAQQGMSAERSLRLAAEAARQTALQDVQTEHDAAELAIQRMEEAEQRIVEVLAEKDRAVTQVQIEAERQREEIEEQARETAAQAQAQVDQAEAKARDAETRARETEMNAQQRIETAERLVTEVRTTLERERSEVDRLRQELADVRKLVEAERNEFRTTLERERSEVDRLRQELIAVQKRADQLEILADKQRTQLMQIQLAEKGTQ